MAFTVMACLAVSTRIAGADHLAPSIDEVRELLQANGTADVGALVGPLSAQQITFGLRRVYPNLPSRADAVIKDVVVSYLREHAAQDHFADRLIPLYAKYLSKDDVRELTGFYRSPIGRKLVAITPELSAESSKMGADWVASILPGLQAELTSRLKAEKLMD
jgi:hypothetical protein